MVKQWVLATVLVCGLLIPATAFGRVWRDQKGNLINADFVKVEAGMIYLKPANKYTAASPFPFYDFCEADQDFVKGILEKKGQSDRIPPPPPRKDDPNGNPNQPAQRKFGNVPVTVIPQTELSTPNNTNGGFQSPTGFSSSTPSNSSSPTVPITVTPTTPPASSTPIPSPPANSPVNAAPTSRGFVPMMGMGPQFKETKQCMSCRKEIPLTSTVGQKCPYCGVFWGAEENQFGQVVKTTPVPLSEGPLFSRGSIRLAFLIGAFVIGGIVKLIHGNK